MFTIYEFLLIAISAFAAGVICGIAIFSVKQTNRWEQYRSEGLEQKRREAIKKVREAGRAVTELNRIIADRKYSND